LPIPRTMARMARERSVRLVFGPKRGQWRMEADLAREAAIRESAVHERGRVILMKRESQQGQRAATVRALNIMQNAQSIQLQTSLSQKSEIEKEMSSGSEPNAAPELRLDPARLALPMSGNGREALRHELAKLLPIDDFPASDQVAQSDRGHREL
jgi:hypothetical protein